MLNRPDLFNLSKLEGFGKKRKTGSERSRVSSNCYASKTSLFECLIRQKENRVRFKELTFKPGVQDSNSLTPSMALKTVKQGARSGR